MLTLAHRRAPDNSVRNPDDDWQAGLPPQQWVQREDTIHMDVQCSAKCDPRPDTQSCKDNTPILTAQFRNQPHGIVQAMRVVGSAGRAIAVRAFAEGG